MTAPWSWVAAAASSIPGLRGNTIVYHATVLPWSLRPRPWPDAHGAWLALTALAHNLVRWVASLGLGLRTLMVIKTQRRRLITLPGR